MIISLHFSSFLFVSPVKFRSVWDGNNARDQLWPWPVCVQPRPAARYAATEVHRWGCPSVCLPVCLRSCVLLPVPVLLDCQCSFGFVKIHPGKLHTPESHQLPLCLAPWVSAWVFWSYQIRQRSYGDLVSQAFLNKATFMEWNTVNSSKIQDVLYHAVVKCLPWMSGKILLLQFFALLH